MRRTLPILALLALAAPALAHEGGLDARGTVVEAGANRLVVKTRQGETKGFAITPSTEVRRGTGAVKPSEIAPGEKAVVHAKRASKGDPEAISIRLAAKAAPSR